MAYSEEVDNRIVTMIGNWKGFDCKKMFGGVCYLLHGNMVCGVIDDRLILRLGAEGAQKALTMDHVADFDITGRPMKGWVMVNSEGFSTDQALKQWLEQAKTFVVSLPPKNK